MKTNVTLKMTMILTVLIQVCIPITIFAEWAYMFVVYNDNIYVISDEYTTSVDKNIGHVTKFSHKEGTYYGNFSNTYEEGTKYYSIKGIDEKEAIAIEDNGRYRIAYYEGEYSGNRFSPFQLATIGIAILAVAALIVKAIMHYSKK